jgi:DNA-binding response OmpR family regulator
MMVNPRKKFRVLVVDDDALVLDIVRLRLEEAGHEVITREEALGAARAIQDESPDVLLLDVNMPGLSGVALANLVTESHEGKPIKVILHSARSQKDLADLVHACGAIGSIAKTGDKKRFLLEFEALTTRSTGRDGVAASAGGSSKQE